MFVGPSAGSTMALRNSAKPGARVSKVYDPAGSPDKVCSPTAFARGFLTIGVALQQDQHARHHCAARVIDGSGERNARRGRWPCNAATGKTAAKIAATAVQQTRRLNPLRFERVSRIFGGARCRVSL
jgi:hypothetical protein